MTKRTVTAFFDDRENANNAALLLRRAGVQDRDISVSPESAATGFAEEMPSHVKKFWAWLDGLFGGTADHASYAEGVRRGGIMVTAHVEQARVDEAAEILERHGSVDLSMREAAWRDEGWTGSRVTGGGAASAGAGPLRSMRGVEHGHADRDAAGVLSTPSPTAPYRRLANTQPEWAERDMAPTIQAQATVGERGRVRIHNHAVEVPSVQDASLRDATGTVDGRPVNRPIAAAETGSSGGAGKIGRAKNMEVLGSDGQHVGVVDRVDGSTITLRCDDPAADGAHHLIPTSWVGSADGQIRLRVTADEARRRWTAA